MNCVLSIFWWKHCTVRWKLVNVFVSCIVRGGKSLIKNLIGWWDISIFPFTRYTTSNLKLSDAAGDIFDLMVPSQSDWLKCRTPEKFGIVPPGVFILLWTNLLACNITQYTITPHAFRTIAPPCGVGRSCTKYLAATLWYVLYLLYYDSFQDREIPRMSRKVARHSITSLSEPGHPPTHITPPTENKAFHFHRAFGFWKHSTQYTKQHLNIISLDQSFNFKLLSTTHWWTELLTSCKSSFIIIKIVDTIMFLYRSFCCSLQIET